MTQLKAVSKYVLGILYILAGVNHFLSPNLYLQIMPPYLHWHLFLVYLSGVFEILFGALVLIPRWTKVGAWGIILVLVAVFPANLHMALNAEDFSFIPAFFLWLRLPFQVVLIAWAYWHTR
jgi:uncharacterized membrane protein